MKSVWIGFDPNEACAFAIARNSARRNLARQIPIRGLILEQLTACELYTRPTQSIINAIGQRQLIDTLSARADYDGRLSTHHAICRFLVPHLAAPGWALFMDGDTLVRGNLTRIFDGLDGSKALYCVKHNHDPSNPIKKGGQLQTRYARKNWSSVMLFNVGHPSNRRLTLEAINTLPGRDLHAFCWLKDHEIGELDPKWNWLVGHSNPTIDPELVHFTDGCPNLPGHYEHLPFADEWRSELIDWAGGFSAAELGHERTATQLAG